MTSDPTAARGAVLTHLFGPCTGRSAPQPRLARHEGGRLATTPQPQSKEESSGRPSASCLPAARAAANVAELSWGDERSIEQQLHAILAAGQRQTLAELAGADLAPDGGISIDSMSAVFLYSIVYDVLARRGMPRLGANSSASDFVSTRSLARLIHRLRRVEAVA